MSKDIEKNRNQAVAGRYWAATPTKRFVTEGVNDHTTVFEARRIAAANLRLMNEVKPLPLGKA
jgi:hypothetical protein